MPRLRMSAALAAIIVPLLCACSSVPPGDPLPGSAAAGDPDAVTCRDVLEPPSNVMRNRCMTAAEWRRYERTQEQGAEEFMRDMLGRTAVSQ